jgi:hypothetical protein
MTSDDKDKLKALETELAETWYRLDRYGDSADHEKLQRIRFMMRSFPPEILQEEALPHFIQAVEHYIMERAYQLLPEFDSLWQHIKTLQRDANSLDKQVVDSLFYWYGELRIRKMKDEGFENTIQQAEKLESYLKVQGKGDQQQIFGATGKRQPIDYQTRLQNMVVNLLGVNAPPEHVETLLTDLREWRQNQQQLFNPSMPIAINLLKYPLDILRNAPGVPGYTLDELHHLKRFMDYQTMLATRETGLKAIIRTVWLRMAERYADLPPTLMKKLFNAPQAILRNIAALEKLGYTQGEIDKLIREAVKNI